MVVIVVQQVQQHNQLEVVQSSAELMEEDILIVGPFLLELRQFLWSLLEVDLEVLMVQQEH